MHFDLLPFSAQLIQARWELDRLPSEELPRLAQDALELGFDGKYTRRIAGLIQPNKRDLQPLMAGFLTELGIKTKLSREQAALVLARLVARVIVNGGTKPYEGARFIWHEIVDGLSHFPKELMPFVGNASEYEDCSRYSQNSEKILRKIDADIVQAARLFLERSTNETS
ncbi:MAG: hypothetical protein WBV31_08885 [Terriglobales bacterium]|jgi:hypothetical protein